MTPVEFLLQRRSCGQLNGPAPTPAELLTMLQCAARAPDHARLKPYRFIAVEEHRLATLGEIYRQALHAKGETENAKLERAQGLPLRAPMVIVALVHYVDSEKAPKQEQLLSAGLATGALINAAQALGLGAIWRTGELAYNAFVQQQLGVSTNESIIGFIYVGTPKASQAKELPVDDVSALLRYF